MATELPSTLDAWLSEQVRHPDYIDEPTEQADHISSAVRGAVDEMIRVHGTTGIDLTQWEPMLPLVLLVYPRIVLEGTGSPRISSRHYITVPTETGRYWLNDDEPTL